MCEHFPQTNLDPCGLAEFFRVPRVNVEGGAVHPLPENVSFEEGALAEPTGCCIRALTKVGGVKPGEIIAILGAGSVGMIHLQLGLCMGASRVMVGDIVTSRLQVARRFGASDAVDVKETDFPDAVRDHTDGIGADLTIVATPNTSAIPIAIRATRKSGRILLFGAPDSGATVQYDTSDIFIREISIIPSYSTSEKEISDALKLIELRRIDVSGLITHRFDFTETLEALRMAESGRDALKVMIITSDFAGAG
jgi:L-iditol 2-dehydrogenase